MCPLAELPPPAMVVVPPDSSRHTRTFRMTRSLLTAFLLAIGCGSAFAQTAADTNSFPAIRAALLKIVPNATIDNIKPTVIPGFHEVAVSGRVVYVSDDGKYLMQGALINLATKANLTESSEAVIRRGVLDGIGRDRRIVFSPANPKYRITVFTDIDCAYCRKLHSQIADYNKAGIAVEYVFFPRAGMNSDSYKKAVSVWCASNRQQALTDAKLDKPVAKKTCPNPVAMEYNVGQRIGIDGTPAIYAADGTQLGGYLSPTDMLAKLGHRTTVAANP
jgi:thiol:disulfide interchange protein DsbC